MTRALLIVFATLSFLSFATAVPALATDVEVDVTNNPAHVGYRTEMGSRLKVNWEPYVTNCDPCKSQVDDYNKLMDTLFDLRWQRSEIELLQERAEKYGKMAREFTEENTENNVRYGKGMSGRMEEGVASILNIKEAADEMGAQIPALEARIKSLETLTAGLRSQITECEKQCKNPEDAKKTGAVGGGGGVQATTVALPFDWRGPYPEVCNKCAKLAARLNELPALARGAIARIENAKAQKALAEIKIMQARAEDSMPPEGEANNQETRNAREMYRQWNKEKQQTIKENEAVIKKAEDEIKANESDLNEIKRNFDQTLKLYNECVPTCPKQTGALTDPVKKGEGDCHYAALPERFIIGPNSEYGSGAAMKDKVKGMAGSALGGLMGGGGGVGLGGGFGIGGSRVDDAIGTEATGGGRNAKGPPTEKDPTRGEWADLDFGPIRMDMRYTMTTDGGLTFSGKIDEAPGDGTFHAAFLQDGSGNTITPKYHLYSLYYDWKLTVWWTYDHWTDGVHDYHDEDEEVTTGRNHVGDWKVYDKPENGIWSQYGFGNASKGINGLGMEYDISKLDLSCPLRMTTYITEPKADPVIATPVSTYLERVRNESGPTGEWKFINDMMVRGAKDAGGGGMQLIDPPLAPPPPPP